MRLHHEIALRFNDVEAERENYIDPLNNEDFKTLLCTGSKGNEA